MYMIASGIPMIVRQSRTTTSGLLYRCGRIRLTTPDSPFCLVHLTRISLFFVSGYYCTSSHGHHAARSRLLTQYPWSSVLPAATTEGVAGWVVVG